MTAQTSARNRQWWLVIWHMRPGRKPHGVIADRRHVYCAACGAVLDQ